MPFRRFRRSKRSMPRRRRPAYRRLKYIPRRNSSKMGYFKLTRRTAENTITNTSTLGISNLIGTIVAMGSPTTSTTALPGFYDIGCSSAFRLNDILNSSDMTNLFDKYKFKWVKLNIYCTSSTAAVTSMAQLPSIIYFIDEDDQAIPTVASLREKMGARQKMFYPGKPVTIFLRAPKVQRQLDTDSLISSGNEVSRAPWINCAYANVPHFGLKFALLDVNLNPTSSSYTKFKFDITYCLNFKDAQ